MIIKTADGSLLDSDGKVLYFSLDRFVADIAHGNCCFICGRSPSAVAFNDEHILSDWILQRYGLIGITIHLPNGTPFRYDQYKVPCCYDCNQMMGHVFETPISAVVDDLLP
jgi:hypothetical protein